MSELFHLMYLSRLAPNACASCVAGIVRASRLRNQVAQIGGLLVFDGARFCQYLEGGEEAVRALADRIRVDERNTDFRVLHQSVFDGPRMMLEYGLEYALSYDNQLDHFEKTLGLASYSVFRDLLPGLDMAPRLQAS